MTRLTRSLLYFASHIICSFHQNLFYYMFFVITAKKCTRYWVGGTKEVMSSGSRRLSYYQRTCAYLSTVRIRDEINDYYSCESPSMACHVCQGNIWINAIAEGDLNSTVKLAEAFIFNFTLISSYIILWFFFHSTGVKQL